MAAVLGEYLTLWKIPSWVANQVFKCSSPKSDLQNSLTQGVLDKLFTDEVSDI